jgi:hypothetical protein
LDLITRDLNLLFILVEKNFLKISTGPTNGLSPTLMSESLKLIQTITFESLFSLRLELEPESSLKKMRTLKNDLFYFFRVYRKKLKK